MPSLPCLPGCECRKHKFGAAHPNFKNSKEATNRHDRVRSQRGRADEYDCVEECGRVALDWAQIHGTTGEDVEDYQPMCRRCHSAYDKDARARDDKGRYRKVKA